MRGGKEKRTVTGGNVSREGRNKKECRWRRETGGRGRKRIWYCYSLYTYITIVEYLNIVGEREQASSGTVQLLVRS